MKANNITNIIAWALIILGIIFIFWKLFGGSPTEFSILITLISGILFKNIDNKFNALASDFKTHIKQ